MEKLKFVGYQVDGGPRTFWWRDSEWREVDVPSRKNLFPLKHLLLLVEAPDQRTYRGLQSDHFRIPAGEVVWIAGRRNARETQHCARDVSNWGSIRILDVEWRCEACTAYHRVYIPESWIEEGKAFFVEEI